MDTRINIAVIVGVVFVLAFAVTLTQYENQAVSQDAEFEISDELITHWIEKYDPSQNTISVSGSATASSEPDTLIVVRGVDAEAKTANESLSQNSNSLNAVISSLTNSGISEDDIQTSNFRIYPLYDFSDSEDKQILVGYLEHHRCHHRCLLVGQDNHLRPDRADPSVPSWQTQEGTGPLHRKTCHCHRLRLRRRLPWRTRLFSRKLKSSSCAPT